MIKSIDPRTGAVIEGVTEESTAEEVTEACVAAATTSEALAKVSRSQRAVMLRAMATELEDDREQLVAIADRESGLGVARLGGELTRTTFQMNFFASVLEEGAYLEATIDHAAPTPMGPRPDLRRILVPLGPIGVFGASNFPFAFSVPGGDTASALAAGCAVVVKAHEGHPRTSIRCAEALAAGAKSTGFSGSPVSLVHGLSAGVQLVQDPRITAVGFTGSLAGGRALFDVAAGRPSPIPFYGELGALNAVIVCPSAAAARHAEFAVGLASSFTLGVGQFCTKPGLAFVPADSAGDAIVRVLRNEVDCMASAVMLSERLEAGFRRGYEALLGSPGVRLLARGLPPTASEGWWTSPSLFEADTEAVAEKVLEECFGPVLVVARYRSSEHLFELVEQVGPGLTATVHADEPDQPLATALLGALSGKAGRIVWNGFPTGVAVSWAIHHGGPYPATTDPIHTSVGAAAIRRWLRPIAYQDVPQAFLPPELHDVPPEVGAVPRRVDGRLEIARGVK